MKLKKIIVAAVLAPLVTEGVDFVQSMLTGRWASGFDRTGLPFPYSKSTGMLGYGSTEFDMVNFVVDTLVWFFVILIVIALISRLKTKA